MGHMLEYDSDIGFLAPGWQSWDESTQVRAVIEHHRATGASVGANEMMHAHVHAIVERQLVAPKLPEAARAVARLLEDGYSRHDAIHFVGRALTSVLFGPMTDEATEDANELLRQRYGGIADRGAVAELDFYAPLLGVADEEDEPAVDEKALVDPGARRHDAWSEDDIAQWVVDLSDLFAMSPEGRQVGTRGWAEAVLGGMLEGGTHPAAIRDGAQAVELLMDAPMDLRCEPADAGAIVAEMEAFYRFAARAFDWPVGDDAAKALRGDLVVRQLAKEIKETPDLEELEDLLRSSGVDLSDRQQLIDLVDLVEGSGGMSQLEPPSAPAVPIRRETPRVGRNAPCPCGSGKKYKKCCGR